MTTMTITIARAAVGQTGTGAPAVGTGDAMSETRSATPSTRSR